MTERPGHIVPLTTYLGVFASLMVLLIATIFAARVDLGWLNAVIMIAIAGVKALLVVLFFMHVKYGSRTTWVFAGAGLLWLMILMGLTLTDYFSRPWPM